MKPSDFELQAAANTLFLMIPFAPSQETAKEITARQIGEFINSSDELKRFVDLCIKHLPEWKGIPQLRAFHAALGFKPADGIAPLIECTVPGFTESDLENQYLVREMEENQKRLESYKAARLLTAPGEQEPFELPEIKTVPQLPPRLKRLCWVCKLSDHPDKFIDEVCPNCGQYSPRPTLKQLEAQMYALYASEKITRKRTREALEQAIREVENALSRM